MRSVHAFLAHFLRHRSLVLEMAFAPPAFAAVYSERQALSTHAVQQFMSDPAPLLSQFPNGGPM
jgi:hypothetical protein